MATAGSNCPKDIDDLLKRYKDEQFKISQMITGNPETPDIFSFPKDPADENIRNLVFDYSSFLPEINRIRTLSGDFLKSLVNSNVSTHPDKHHFVACLNHPDGHHFIACLNIYTQDTVKTLDGSAMMKPYSEIQDTLRQIRVHVSNFEEEISKINNTKKYYISSKFLKKLKRLHGIDGFTLVNDLLSVTNHKDIQYSLQEVIKYIYDFFKLVILENINDLSGNQLFPMDYVVFFRGDTRTFDEFKHSSNSELMMKQLGVSSVTDKIKIAARFAKKKFIQMVCLHPLSTPIINLEFLSEFPSEAEFLLANNFTFGELIKLPCINNLTVKYSSNEETVRIKNDIELLIVGDYPLIEIIGKEIGLGYTKFKENYTYLYKDPKRRVKGIKIKRKKTIKKRRIKKKVKKGNSVKQSNNVKKGKSKKNRKSVKKNKKNKKIIK